MNLLAILLMGVTVGGGTIPGGTVSGERGADPEARWAVHETGSGRSGIEVSASAGDRLPSHLIHITSPSGTLNYSVAVSGIGTCPVSDWISTSATGSVVAGTDEKHAITFTDSNDCTAGSATATVTFSDDAAGLEDQVFTVTATVGAAEAAGSYDMTIVGDSQSDAVVGSPDTDANWLDDMPPRYKGGTITNYAESGDTLGEARIILDAKIVTPGIPAADICIIQGGTNDAIQGIAEATSLAEVQAMVDACQANGNTFIAIMGPPYLHEPASFTNCGGSKAACDGVIDSLNAGMQAIAVAEGVGWMSMKDTLGRLTQQEVCFDTLGIHPGQPNAINECIDIVGSDLTDALDAVRPGASLMIWGADAWGTKTWGT